MQVSVDTTSQIERRITVQVPAAEVDEAVNARLKDAAKTVRMDGFRKGKVPMSVIRQRYGHDVRNEVVGEVMRERYVRAISENELNPAGFPQIEVTVNESGKDLEFVATLEVYPEITLASIEGTEVERPVVEVVEADVDEMIETLRKQNAGWEEVERAAADGDRSEEHTSELQSRPHLVCRLLLEKKKRLSSPDQINEGNQAAIGHRAMGPVPAQP